MILTEGNPMREFFARPATMSAFRSIFIVLTISSAWLPFSSSQAADAARPNIVIFLVDDMGIMDTSVPFLTNKAGQPQRHPLNDFYRTPNMLRLAERGIRFNQFCAMSVCSPSRVSLMTGQNSARHRTTNWISPFKNNRGEFGPPEWNWQGIRPQTPTLPRLLQQAGYRTIHVGKGHFGPQDSPAEDPRHIGFDINIAGSSIGHPASYYGMKNYGEGKPNVVPGLDKYHQTETFLTDALTLEARDQITTAVRDQQPFFLYLAHYAVHAPFNVDPRFAAHYKDSEQSPSVQAFATLIEGMDKSLGDLLDHLQSLNIAEETLVIFLGDNGTDARIGGPEEIASAAPLRGMKGACYEGGTRVPFIISWAHPDSGHPRQKLLPIARGAVQSQQAAIYDILPTLLELTGISPPKNHPLDGTPLQKLLTGQREASRPESFLMHFPHEHRSNYFTSCREGRWKVIYHYIPSEKYSGWHYELFDLEQDPSESNNLAARQPDQLHRMMQKLVAGLESQQALFPVEKDGITPLKPIIP